MAEPGRMRGLLVRECGQMGVTKITLSDGCAIDPPAASE
jgi:hypothetical protein